MPKPQIPTSDQLFLPSPAGEGFIERDFDATQQGAVSIKEHYAGLIALLDIQDRLVDLDQLGRSAPLPKEISESTKLTKQQAKARNAKRAAALLRGQSKEVFDNATGVEALKFAEDNGDIDTPLIELERNAQKQYDYFTRRFAGRHKTKERFQVRTKWTGLLSIFSTEPNPVVISDSIQAKSLDTEKVPSTQETDTSQDSSDMSAINKLYEDKLREDKAAVLKRRAQPKPEGLTTIERMRALKTDPRAGFFPTTNTEKNQLLAYLDYLDGHKYMFGIVNQLEEIYAAAERDQRLPGEERGLRGTQAVSSNVFQIVGYFEQASQQLEQLQAFNDEVSNIFNPHLTYNVASEDAMHDAFPLVVRYLDLKEFAATGKIAGLKMHPLTTTRIDLAEQPQGRNKLLFDRYTAPDRHETFAKHIEARARQMSIGDLRKIMNEVMSDQEARVVYNSGLLQQIASVLSGNNYMSFAHAIATEALANTPVPPLKQNLKKDTIAS